MNSRTQSGLIYECQTGILRIITNSVYGNLGQNVTFEQYNKETASRITEEGREIISKLKRDNEEGNIIQR